MMAFPELIKAHLLEFLMKITFKYLKKINRYLGFPGSASGKEPICQCKKYKRHGFDPWVRKIPWRWV